MAHRTGALERGGADLRPAGPRRPARGGRGHGGRVRPGAARGDAGGHRPGHRGRRDGRQHPVRGQRGQQRFTRTGAAGLRRGRAPADAHRLRRRHEPGGRPLHPPGPSPDRWSVHRAHRCRTGRRDRGRGLHRDARPLTPSRRARPGGRRLVGRGPGVGGHPQGGGQRAPARPAARPAAGGAGGSAAVRLRHRAGHPPDPPPDPRPGRTAAAGDGRVLRRRAARRHRGTAADGPRWAAAAGQRRGGPAAGPAGRRARPAGGRPGALRVARGGPHRRVSARGRAARHRGQGARAQQGPGPVGRPRAGVRRHRARPDRPRAPHR